MSWWWWGVQLLSCVQPFGTRGLEHIRPPCPSLSPAVCSDSHPLSRWCLPTISYSVISFSSSPQSFPASGSFPVCQLFTSGGQSFRASLSAAIFPMNIQGCFHLGWTGLIFLLSKGLSRVFSSTTSTFERISSPNENSGPISFFPLVVQGNLKGLLQHHSSKTPILGSSAFFIPLSSSFF